MKFYRGSSKNLEEGSYLVPDMDYIDNVVVDYSVIFSKRPGSVVTKEHKGPYEPRVYFTGFFHFAMAFALRGLALSAGEDIKISFEKPYSNKTPVQLYGMQRYPDESFEKQQEVIQILSGMKGSDWTPWPDVDDVAYVYELQPELIYNESGRIQKSNWNRSEKYHTKNEPVLITKKHIITLADFLNHPAGNQLTITYFDSKSLNRGEFKHIEAARQFWSNQKANGNVLIY